VPPKNDFDVTIGAELADLRKELGTIPGITAAEAKRMTIALEKEYQRSTKAAQEAAKAAAAAGKKAGKEFDSGMSKAAGGLESLLSGGPSLSSFGSILGGVGETAGTASASIAAMAGPIGIAAAAAVAASTAMFTLANSASAYVDKVSLVAGQTGLASDTVIALDYALQAGGASLDEAKGGLVDFSNKLGQAATQGGSTAEMFAKLGVDVKNADGSIRDVDAVLRETLRAIGQYPTSTERAAAAIAVFGSEGSKLVAALGAGTESLDEWSAAAKNAGLVISDDAAQGSAAMDEALASLNMSLDAVTLALGTQFAPAVAGAVEVTADAITTTLKLYDATENIRWAFNSLNPLVWVYRGAVWAVSDASDEASTATADLEAEMARLGPVTEAAADAMARLSEVTKQADEAQDKLLQLTQKLSPEQMKATKEIEAAKLALQDLTAAKKAGADITDLEILQAQNEVARLEGLVAAIRRTEQATEDSKKAKERAAEASKKRAEAAREAEEALRRQGEATQKLRDIIAETTEDDLNASQQIELAYEKRKQAATDAYMAGGETAQYLAALDAIEAERKEELAELDAKLHAEELARLDETNRKNKEAQDGRIADAQRAAAAIARSNEQEAASYSATLGMVQNLAQTIIDRAEEGTEAQKKAGLAAFYIQQSLAFGQISIDTARATMAALADPTLLGPAKGLAVAAAIAAGISSAATVAATPAPSFHTGLASDETAAVLTRGESVLTPRATQALGGPDVVDAMNRGLGGFGGSISVALRWRGRDLDRMVADTIAAGGRASDAVAQTRRSSGMSAVYR
jgi:hypothetical protein